MTVRCHCGLAYTAFRCGYTSHRGTKGQLATPNATKAGAWEEHVARCDVYAAPGALDFDPATLGPPKVAGTVGLTLDALRAIAYAEPTHDDFGGDLSPEDEDWHSREREARRVLGADFARVTEAA